MNGLLFLLLAQGEGGFGEEFSEPVGGFTECWSYKEKAENRGRAAGFDIGYRAGSFGVPSDSALWEVDVLTPAFPAVLPPECYNSYDEAFRRAALAGFFQGHRKALEMKNPAMAERMDQRSSWAAAIILFAVFPVLALHVWDR